MGSRRYLWLMAAVALGALGLSALGTTLGRRTSPAATGSSHAPSAALHLTLRDGLLTPASAQVPKGERLLLTVTNEGRRPVTLSLRGYEDRLVALRLAPSETVRRDLLVDRPGEDFPWLLDEIPAGRLTVSGSHLIEGHR